MVRQITGAQLDRLVAGWEDGVGTKAQKLSTAIAELMETQEVPLGSQLPAERDAAAALRISRASVAEAYGILRAQGLAESVRGSGTRLHRPTDGQSGKVEPTSRLASFSESATVAVDLTSGTLDGLALVANEWSRVGTATLLAHLAGDGYEPRGLLGLRELVSERFVSAGLPTEPDEILVTSGSQQALEIISRVWIDPGERVIVEDPTYRGALEAFRAQQARLSTVSMESDGMDVESLGRMVKHSVPRFVYSLPAAHNPTGVHLSEAKRHELVRLLAGQRVLFVEDTSNADLMLGDTPPPPLVSAGLDPARAVVIGSLSKLFWGGLRIGWIRAPRPMVERFQRAKVAMDLGTSVPSQLLAQRLLPYTDEARAQRRQTLTHGLDMLTTELADKLPDWTWVRPRGGSGLWIRMPGRFAVEFTDRARKAQVAVTPGPAFSAVGGQDQCLRLPFGRPERITAGMEILADTWSNMVRTAGV